MGDPATASASTPSSWRRRRWLAGDRFVTGWRTGTPPARRPSRGPRAGRRAGSNTVADAAPGSTPRVPTLPRDAPPGGRWFGRARAPRSSASRPGRRTRGASSTWRLEVAQQAPRPTRPSPRRRASRHPRAGRRRPGSSPAPRPRRTARAGGGGSGRAARANAAAASRSVPDAELGTGQSQRRDRLVDGAVGLGPRVVLRTRGRRRGGRWCRHRRRPVATTLSATDPAAQRRVGSGPGRPRRGHHHQARVARIPALRQQRHLDVVLDDRLRCSLTCWIIDPAYGQNGVVRIILISVSSSPRMICWMQRPARRRSSRSRGRRRTQRVEDREFVGGARRRTRRGRGVRVGHGVGTTGRRVGGAFAVPPSRSNSGSPGSWRVAATSRRSDRVPWRTARGDAQRRAARRSRPCSRRPRRRQLGREALGLVAV